MVNTLTYIKMNCTKIYISLITLLCCLSINTTSTAQWNNHEDFESSWGIWNDGGADALRLLNANIELPGAYSARIRDNSGVSSSIYTNTLDLTGNTSMDINFSFYPESMESGEFFLLEFSNNGGQNFEHIQSFVSGTDFTNGTAQTETISFNRTFGNQCVFRFRCDASSNYDLIYLDNITMTANGINPPAQYDCPSLSANIGDACNDGNANTENDVISANCNCVGTTIPPPPPPGMEATCDGRIACFKIEESNGNTLGNVSGTEYCSDVFSNPNVKILAETTGSNGSMNFMIITPTGIRHNVDNSAGYRSYSFDVSMPGKYTVYIKLYSDDNKGGLLCDQGYFYFTIKTCATVYDCPALNANIGDSCNDGNPNTTNDIINASCNCVGTPIGPIYDCPALSANIGDSCNDGNPNTTNDIINANCNCEGTPVTGGCTHSLLHYTGFETDLGEWVDGGSDCSRFYEPGPNTVGDYCIRLRDNSGNASSLISKSLNLQDASEVKIDFMYLAESMEPGEDFFLEYSTNGGVTYTNIQRWIAGTDFSNGSKTVESVTYSGNFGADTRFRFRCDASSNYDIIYLDEILVYACQGGGSSYDCPALSANIGDSCNDGNPNTINDVITANCNCAGTPIGPNFDCPSLNANIGDSCNDGNPNTTNDIINANCNCEGTPITTGCKHQLVDYQGFETGMGIWNDGGSDCSRSFDVGRAAAGNYAMRLRDNSIQESSMISDPLDFHGVNECKIDFSYVANSMETGEDFILEYSTNGGATYTAVKSWVSGSDFINGVAATESVSFSGNFTSQTLLRFRCDASSNYDQVYLDEISINACGGKYDYDKTADDKLKSNPNTDFDTEPSVVLFDEVINLVKVFPNPVSDVLYVELEVPRQTLVNVSLYTRIGQMVINKEIDLNVTEELKLDLDGVESGTYILRIAAGDDLFFEKIIVAK